MIKGQFPTGKDLQELLAEIDGIRLESTEPEISRDEQWVAIPDQTCGFVCKKDASLQAVETLRALLISLQDTSELLESSQKTAMASQKMERLAMLDPLTELPNRRKLFSFVNDMVNNDTDSAVLQIDLDRFKQINDSLGHAAGDEVLVVVANRLSANVRPGDLVARIGGDEFVVACPNVTSTTSMAELAERLVKSLNEPMMLEGMMHNVGVSIGVSFKDSEETLSADTLLQNADLALYTSKEKGRNQYHLYKTKMRERFDTVQSLRRELSEACDNGSIVAHFQPIFSISSDKVIGVQAMARWQHSEMGLMTYGEFEQHADESVLVNIDNEMLSQCLKGIQKLNNTNTNLSKFSVTVSIKRMSDPNFVAHLLSATEQQGLEPKQVSLEIVENGKALSGNVAFVKNTDLVRDAGFGISISNFGGYSSNLQSLIDIEPHSIKLDGSLSRDLQHNGQKRRLLSGIISMAENLHATVVATAVQSEADRDILAELGCDFIQGRVMLPPSDINTLASWLDKNSALTDKAA
jgi:diguanylate cyclase (GGDEF)-like protein